MATVCPPFFLFLCLASAGRADIINFQIVGDYLLWDLLLQLGCEIGEADVRERSAFFAYKMVVLYDFIITVRVAFHGNLSDLILFVKQIEIIIYRGKNDLGV
jgi:hypothetical protein